MFGLLKKGTSRASRIYQKKETAIQKARKMRKAEYDIIIHKRDGSIQQWEKANN